MAIRKKESPSNRFYMSNDTVLAQLEISTSNSTSARTIKGGSASSAEKPFSGPSSSGANTLEEEGALEAHGHVMEKKSWHRA